MEICESLRIVVKQPAQQFMLLQTSELCGKIVEITEPWSISRKRTEQVSGDQPLAPNTYADAVASGRKLGVVYGVPSDVTPDEVKNLVDAVDARRLTPMTESNKNEAYSVLLSFTADTPPYVEIAPFSRLKISQYAPRPMQCKKMLVIWSYVSALQEPSSLRVLCYSRACEE
jgi:hypothetical protein